DELFLVPDVIARGVSVDGEVGELLHDRLGDAEAAGGVLDVDDREVDLLPIDDVLELLAQRAPAGLADDVADVEDADHSVQEAANSEQGTPARCSLPAARFLFRIINSAHLPNDR